MKLVELSVVCLWGALFLCANADSSNWPGDALAGEPPCVKAWRCEECAFQDPRSCCCVANEVFALEESNFQRIWELKKRLTRVENGVNEITGETHIAFTAIADFSHYLNSCFGPFTTNVTIPYTNVVLDQGYGYNPTLGIFTAPRSGQYVFSVVAYSRLPNPEGRLYHKVQLMNDGDVIATIWEDNREDSEDTGTQVTTLTLERGSQVYIQLAAGRNLCDLNGSNIFSGYLLYPLNSAPY